MARSRPLAARSPPGAALLPGASEVVTHAGSRYVVLRGAAGVLAVYEVSNSWVHGWLQALPVVPDWLEE